MLHFLSTTWTAIKERAFFLSKKRLVVFTGAILSLLFFSFLLVQPMLNRSLYQKVFTNRPHLSENAILSAKKQTSLSWFKEQHFYSLWQIQSRDQLKLRAYFLPASGVSDQVVILLHGYHQKPEDLFDLAKMYHEKFGFHILVPGMRGQLPSEGKNISFGWHDQHDLQDWIQLLSKRLDRKVRVILHGCSSGAAAAIMTASTNESTITAVIADSSFGSLEEFIKAEHPNLFSGLCGRFLTHKLNTQLKKEQGFQFSDLIISDYLESCQPPILFIHGLKDTIVSPSVAYQLKIASSPAGAKRVLSLFQNGQHAQNFEIDPDGYQKTIRYFLQPDAANSSFFPSSITSDVLKNINISSSEEIPGIQWLI